MDLKVEAKGEYNGRKIKISPRAINYSFEDLKASVDPNTFNIKVNDYGKSPKIIAKIGDKTSTLSLYDENTKLIKMKINNVNYTINGQAKKMDAKPFISNSRTLVPLRFIVEAIGGDVAWDGDNRIVTVNSFGKTIVLPIDSKKINVDGKDVAIDQAAIIKGDRTYVPIRFIAENLNMNVNYINETREIEISYFENKEDKVLDSNKENNLQENNVENAKSNNLANQNNKENNNKIDENTKSNNNMSEITNSNQKNLNQEKQINEVNNKN